MPFNELLLYMGFVVGFAITPGPNMMLYLAHTFEYGRMAGWATVAGITSAFLFHITALLLGLSALLMASPHALDVLRYLGMAYLFFLAWKNLKPVNWKSNRAGKEIRSLKQFYLAGLIGNLLNPGTAMLYFSLIPQFIRPERGGILIQNLKLCGLQMLGSTVTNSVIVLLAGFATDAFFKNEQIQKWVRYAMSLFIVAFAVKMLFWKTK
jgi:threonine/homoserine/homoserine lactone efflux protein